MMWLPVALTPVVAVAGVAGVVNRRMAKQVLAVVSAGGGAQRPAGHVSARAGRVATTGRMAPRPLQRGDGTADVCAAAVLAGRRHGARRRDPAAGTVTRARPPSRRRSAFPASTSLAQSDTWDDVTRAVVLDRVDRAAAVTFFTAREERHRPCPSRPPLGPGRRPGCRWSSSSTRASRPATATDIATATCPRMARRGGDPSPASTTTRATRFGAPFAAARRRATSMRSSKRFRTRTGCGMTCRPHGCSACGCATRAPRSTPTRGHGTRSASAGRPTRVGTRTSASTGASPGRRRQSTPHDPVPWAQRVEAARRRHEQPTADADG